MGKIISAGVIVRSCEGKILLGRSDKCPQQRNWTVFKGQQKSGESIIETAIRELYEETGIDVVVDDRLNMNMSTSIFFSYNMKGKIVNLYLLDDVENVLDDFPFECSSFSETGQPEISAYNWFDVDDLEENLMMSQHGLIKVLRTTYDAV